MGKHLIVSLICVEALCFFNASEPLTLVPGPLNVPHLSTFTFLYCGLQPPDARVNHGWRLPSGEFLTPDNHTSQFQVSALGRSRRVNNAADWYTVMVFTINALSYELAGEYSCEVQDSTTPRAEWTAAVVELQLQGTVFIHTLHLNTVYIIYSL